tara:strand:- start:257 stop:469 length:213 start_codon:yes stop_codon:yes gene_type:complete
MKLKLVNEPGRLFVKCEECNELIGTHAPAVETSYGFVGEDGFYIEDSIVMHAECVTASILHLLLKKIERN